MSCGAGQAQSRTDGERVERERQDESDQRRRDHLQIISAVPQDCATETEGAATIAGAAYAAPGWGIGGPPGRDDGALAALLRSDPAGGRVPHPRWWEALKLPEWAQVVP